MNIKTIKDFCKKIDIDSVEYKINGDQDFFIKKQQCACCHKKTRGVSFIHFSQDKINERDLIYYEYQGENEYPCLIVYNSIGMILAPKIENN